MTAILVTLSLIAAALLTASARECIAAHRHASAMERADALVAAIARRRA